MSRLCERPRRRAGAVPGTTTRPAQVVAVAACRDTVAVATARSISLLRLEGAADVRELRRCASPGGSVVAVAVVWLFRLAQCEAFYALTVWAKRVFVGKFEPGARAPRVCRAVKIRFDRGHVGTAREDTLTF